MKLIENFQKLNFLRWYSKGGFGPFSRISSLLNPARTAEKIEKKVNEKILENRDILAPAVKTALEFTKNRSTLVPALKTLSTIKKKIKSSEVTPTKDIMEVIRSLENRGILLKGTATKINIQKGGQLNKCFTINEKCVLVPLGLTAAASAIDTTIQKKIFGLGMTTLIFANEDLNDIMKIIKSLEDSGLKSKFNRVYSRNLAKKRNVRNLDEYKSMGVHWIALYVNSDNGT